VLKVSLQKNIPIFFINRESLSFILKETLNNSIDILKGSKRGVIAIKACLSTKKSIPKSISSLHQRGIHITIQDNGPGISARHKDKIWELGFSKKPGGTGLGLFGVSFIVEQLGGVCFENGLPTRGAIFNIFLPLKEEL